VSRVDRWRAVRAVQALTLVLVITNNDAAPLPVPTNFSLLAVGRSTWCALPPALCRLSVCHFLHRRGGRRVPELV